MVLPTQPVTYVVKGIKCDATECDYSDMEAEFDPDKYLNMPCPECGANLFTEEDYRAMAAMQAVTNITNEVFKDVEFSENAEVVHYDIGMDGSGKPVFKVIEKGEEDDA